MRNDTPSVDAIVRERLSQWPQIPPGIETNDDEASAWLRGRPDQRDIAMHPYLKLPGSDRYRTFPDGLWLKFGGSAEDPFVDIFAIEACSSTGNLLDKRSRFSPSTHSLVAVCPVTWLRQEISPTEPTLRWTVTGFLSEEPTRDLIFPVRDVRVLYGLDEVQYDLFARHQVPHAHEYFVPMESLMAEEGHRAPALQALVARASMSANFLKPPRRLDQQPPKLRRRSIPGALAAAMELNDVGSRGWMRRSA